MKLSATTISKTPGGILLMLILFLSACQTDHSVALKPILDAYIDAWNTGELDGLDQVVDVDIVRNSPATSPSNAEGIDSLRSVISSFRTGFPDLNVSMDDVIYAENSASLRWTVTATNTGPLNMPPTGKSVEISGISMFQFNNGKISNEWVEFDNLDFEQQLGFVISPPAAPLEADATEVDPDHYKVEFENERVRVIRIAYGPGEKSVMHDHMEGVLVIFDDFKSTFTLPDGSSVEASGKARGVQWSPAGSHLPENTTGKAIEVVLVELKTQ